DLRQTNNSPFSTMSAACAYDKKHNRLYYTPMGINQLRYIDLNGKDPKVFYFENEPFGSVSNLQDEANHITRMVVASDGNGYALSNDGNHLIRFTTGKKTLMSDLGKLVDDENNKDVSVHLRCSSWGGDMVADAFGKLYLVSARQAVFVIDLESRVATFKGYITGLPANYTTNGAVVDGDGNVVVSSANATNAYYTVDLNTLKASALKAKEKVFNTSDLANGNFALQKEADKKASAVSAAQVDRRDLIRNDHVTIYPNPVTEGNFRMYFKDQRLGKYEIQLVDLTGRIISAKSISIVNKTQVEEVNVNDNLARGLYLLKLVGGNKRAQFADRILVQ
ncbi:MAG TPA: T9SS type A sorting domain-containing protein, partial [Chitinophagaceae bacterium]|nr:T9SS type A sorting domain-containing protein [Chitinophagaceae bacterium]